MKTKFKKGFTLVELVIVIAVIAILSAVLIPTFSSVIKRAKKSSAMQTATSIRTSYFTDYSSQLDESIDNMKGYIIQFEDNIYIVSDNGDLVEFDGTLQEAMGDNEYDMGTFYPNNHESIIYKPTGEVTENLATKDSGIYVNDTLTTTWSDLISNGYITIEDADNGNENEFILTGINYPVWQNGADIRLIIDEHIVSIEEDWEQCAESSFTSVYFPNSITSIDPYIFYYMPDLAEICMENDNPNFYCDNNIAIYSGSSLIRTINASSSKIDYTVLSAYIKDGNAVTVDSVNAYSFAYTEAFDTITIPASITSMYGNSFFRCFNNQFAVAHQNERFYTDGYALYNIDGALISCARNSSVSEYTIRENITIGDTDYPITLIEQTAFYETRNLSRITIHAGVTEIRGGAFQNCLNLTSIVFCCAPDFYDLIIFGGSFGIYNNNSIMVPTNVYTLTDEVNPAITSNSSIFSGRSVTYKVLRNPGIYNLDNELIIPWDEMVGDIVFVTEGTITSFSFTPNYDYKLEIADTVTTIADNAFEDSTRLKSVVFGSNTISIGVQSFLDSSIKSIDLPAQTTLSIGSFEGSAIETITLPASVTSIPANTFKNSALSNIILSEAVLSIGANAFENTSITSILLPATVASIGEYAFTECSYLSVISFEHTSSDDLTIGTRAFYISSFLDTTINAYTIPAVNTAIDTYNWEDSNRSAHVEQELASGIYDVDDNLILSWADALNYHIIETTIRDNKLTLSNLNYYDQYFKLVVDSSIEAFSDCFAWGAPMVSITIPASVTTAYGSLVTENYLEEIKISPANTHFYFDEDQQALYSRNALVEVLGTNTDSSFTVHSQVTIAGVNYTITEITREAFCYDCHFLSLTISATITTIDPYAIYALGLHGLASITVENGNQYYMFENNTLYRKYTFNNNNGVMIVGFTSKNTLTSITTPESVMFGDDELDVVFASYLAFNNLYSVVDITFTGKICFAHEIDYGNWINSPNALFLANPNDKFATIHTVDCEYLYTDGIGLYQDDYLIGIVTTYTGSYTILSHYTIDDTEYTVTKMAEDIFRNKKLTSLIIPTTFTRLPQYAIAENYSLTYILIPASVTYIENCAVYNNMLLSRIELLHSADDNLTIAGDAFNVDITDLNTTIVAVKNGSENIGINPSIYNYDWENSGRNVTFEFAYESGVYNSSNNERVATWSELISSTDTEVNDGVLTTFAYTTDLSNYYVVIDNSVTSIGASAFAGNTKIDLVSLGKFTTNIGASAFSGCSNLTEVSGATIVTTIGANAFSGCALLENINISGATTIGASAFYGCASLEEVTLNKNLAVINESTFEGTALTSIAIPVACETIGNRAFYGITTLDTIRFSTPNNVEISIGTNAFFVSSSTSTTLRCANVTDEIENYSWISDNRDVSYGRYYEAGVYDLDYNVLATWEQLIDNGNLTLSGTTITYYSYYHLGQFYNLVVEEGITNINSLNNSYYIKELTLPRTVNASNLNSYFDSYNNHLTKIIVDVGEGALYSDGVALYYNNQIRLFAQLNPVTSYTMLNYYTIGSTDYYVNSLDFNIIYSNTLTSLTLSAYMTYFYAPTVMHLNLEHIYISEGSAYFASDGKAIYRYYNDDGCSLVYLAKNSCLDTRIYTIPEQMTINNVDYDVININSQACWGAKVNTIIIPETVTEIYNQAFQYAEITSIIIPRSVNYISGQAFYLCNNLTKIQFNHTSLDYMNFGDSVFYSNSERSLTVKANDDAPIEIYDYYYEGDNRIVTFKPLVEAGIYSYNSDTLLVEWDDIEDYATIENGVLSAVSYDEEDYYIVLDSNVTAIDDDTFKNNTLIYGIYMKDVETIGDSAFEGATNLEFANLMTNVTSIGDSSFYGCESLTNVAFGDGLLTIGTSAFRGTSLTTLVIPASVTSIGDNAFYGIQGLTVLYFNHEENTLEIGENAFYVDQEDEQNIDTTLNVNYPIIDALNDPTDGYDWDASNRDIEFVDMYIPGLYTLSGALICTWEEAMDWGYINFYDGALSNIDYYGNYFHLKVDKNITSYSSNLFGNENMRELTLPRSITYSYDSNYPYFTSQAGVEKFNLVGATGDMWTDGYGLYYKNAMVGYAKAAHFTEYSVVEETHIGNKSYRIEEIFGEMFFNDYILEEITLPKYLTKIHDQTFSNTRSLINIIVDDENEYFYFDGKCLYCRDTIVTLAFANTGTYTTRQQVTICDTVYDVTKIGSFAFRSLIDHLIISEGIVESEQHACGQMENIETIEIPSSLIIIPYEFAYACPNLTTIIFNHNEEFEIQSGAFTHWNSDYVLTTIKIDLSLIDIVQSYDWDQSRRIPQYQSIVDPGIYAYSNGTIGQRLFNYQEMYDNSIIEVSNDTLTGFNYNESDFAVVLGDDISAIANASETGVFEDNGHLCEVQFSYSLTYIGSSAFKGCEKLENVSLFSIIEYIGPNAFYGCNLSSVNIPTEIDTIYEGTFYGNPLTYLYVPLNITLIKSNAFGGNDNFETIEFAHEDDDTLTINENAFMGTELIELIVSAFYDKAEDTINEQIEDYEWLDSYKDVDWNYKLEPGLYNRTTGERMYTWQELIDYGYMTVDDNENVSFTYNNNSVRLHLVMKPDFKKFSIWFGGVSVDEITLPEKMQQFGRPVNADPIKYNLSPNNKYFYTSGTDMYSRDSFLHILDTQANADYQILSQVTIAGKQYTITKIGYEAITRTSHVNTLRIPATINQIGSNNFGWVYNLNNIIVDPANPTFTSYEGSLYSKSGSGAKLYRVATNEEDYEMPETVTINGEVLPVTSAVSEALEVSSLRNITLSSNYQWTSDQRQVFHYNAATSVTVRPGGNSNVYVDQGTVVYAEGKVVMMLDSYKNISSSYKILDSYQIGNRTYLVTDIVFNAFYETELVSLELSNNMTSVTTTFQNLDNLTTFIIPASCRNVQCGFTRFALNTIVFKHSYSDPLTISESTFEIPSWSSISSVPTTIVVYADSYETINPAITAYDWAGNSRPVTYEYVKSPGTFNTSGALMSSWDSMEGNGDLTVTDGVLTEFTRPSTDYILVVPETVTGITANLFKNDSHLVGIIFNNGLEEIGASAFEGCANLEEVKFASTITTIGASAFKDCSSLATYSLPTSLETVGSYAFFNTSNTMVEFVSSVTSIGEYAFANNNSLTKIAFNHSNDDDLTIGNYAFNISNGTLATTVVRKAYPSINTDVTSYDWSGSHRGTPTTKNLYPAGLYYTSNGERAYSWAEMATNGWIEMNGENLRQIYIPSNTSYKLVLDDSVKTLDTFIDGYCSGLRELVLPRYLDVNEKIRFCNSYITSYDIHPLSTNLYCDNNFAVYSEDTLKIMVGVYTESYTILSEVTINGVNSTITSIDYTNSVYVVSLTIPETISYICDDFFFNYTNTASVIFAGSNPNIRLYNSGIYMVTDDSNAKLLAVDPSVMRSITTFTMPDTIEIGGENYDVHYVNRYAFGQCENLATLTLSNNLYIDTDELLYLYNCFDIQTINMNNPSSMSNVYVDNHNAIYVENVFMFLAKQYSGAYTILYQYSLNGETYSVTKFAEGAITSCPGITSLYIDETMDSVGDDSSIYGVTSLTDVYYTGTYEKFHSNYWSNCDFNDATFHFEYGWELTGHQDPTCEEAGYNEYTNSVNGRVKIVPIAKLPHTYENGICSVCGAEEPGLEIVYEHDGYYAFSYDSQNDTYTSTNAQNDGTTSKMTVTSGQQIEITVHFSVDSEESFDILYFYLNDEYQAEFSGNGVNGQISFMLNENSVLRIEYQKDGSVSNGSDSATVYITINE